MPAFAKTGLGRFLSAAASFFEGWALLASNPRWWRYAAWPILIQLICSLVFLVAFNHYAADFVRGFFENVSTQWLRESLLVLAHVLTFFVSCLLSGILWVAIAGIVCPFFYEKLTRNVELSLGTPESELKGLSIVDEIREAVVIFLQLISIQIVLIAIAFFPVIGAPLALILGWYVTAWKLGSEVFDYPLSIRGEKKTQRRIIRRQFKPEVLGIGTIVIAIASVPVLGSILLVPCLIGAVTLHHRIHH